MIMNSICGDEQHLYSGGYDNKVKGWTDLTANQPRALFTSSEAHEGEATCVAYFGNQLFSGGADGKIRVGIPELG